MYLDKFTKEVSINGDLICDFIEDSEGLHFGVLFGSKFKESKKYDYLHTEPIEEEFKVIEEVIEDDDNTEPFEDNYDIEANF